MALVTIKSLDGQPIEDVTNALYRQWGVGKKGKDEGLLFLLAIQDHRDRIEVGYGLEPILPDGLDGSVTRSIQPLLRQGAYGPAMLSAAQRIGSTIARAKGTTPQANARPRYRETSRGRDSRGRRSSSASWSCFFLCAAGAAAVVVSWPACFSVIY